MSTTEIEFTWAELIVQKRGIEEQISQLEKQIGELEADDENLPSLKGKLKDARETITAISKKIEDNFPLFMKGLSKPLGTPQELNVKEEEKPLIHNTGDIFSNSPVTLESSSSENNSSTLHINRMAKLPKPPHFKRGDNFIRWTKRFKEHLSLSGQLQGTDISTYMLSHVNCESTWDRLHRLVLGAQERCNVDLLIKRYTEEMFPPTQSWTIRTELMAQKQSSTETVQEFCSRIEELASKAGYASETEKEQGCLQVLIIGARDTSVKTKLYESQLTSYGEAVKLAVNTERIAEVAGGSNTSFTPSHDQIFALNQGHGSHNDRPYNQSFEQRRTRFSQHRPQTHNGHRGSMNSYTPWTANVVSNRFRGGMSNYNSGGNHVRSERPHNAPINQRPHTSRTVNCWFCGRPGHYQRDCYQRNSARGTYRSLGDRFGQNRDHNSQIRPNNNASLNLRGAARM